ncbi:uncharacterized protein EAF01_010858 [Botrytis porri]|uniref:uncharacterized protein n=1 Tax=Botrytis porri TaxID=87229 RepID=UPI0019014281|nr:uncharacterized protein EAF01_010858 [Botrytis porri]KAF7889365.1 hypothetical protein EAF01_010858 [Botrytis porri]
MSEMMLQLAGGMEFSSNPAIKKTLTLRNMCQDYRDGGGREWRGTSPPELDGAVEVGRMCRMRSFDNSIGVPHNNSFTGFDMVDHANDISLFMNCVRDDILTTLAAKRLWCPTGLKTVTNESQRLPDDSALRRWFTYDSQVTPVTGIIGTLHNNTAIDLVIPEDPKKPDINARAFKDVYMGFYCAGHTSHSDDKPEALYSEVILFRVKLFNLTF